MTNTQEPDVFLLGGPAAAFKGSRKYVHGTDVIPSIDLWCSTARPGFYMSAIDFHARLTRIGVLSIDSEFGKPIKSDCCATGTLANAAGSNVTFSIFASPYPISHRREFAEEQLIKVVRVGAPSDRCELAINPQFTLLEHISTTMKVLCRRMLPQHKHWWFVRFRKSTPLPQRFSHVAIVFSKGTLDRFITSAVIVDGAQLGEIVFAGDRDAGK